MRRRAVRIVVAVVVLCGVAGLGGGGDELGAGVVWGDELVLVSVVRVIDGDSMVTALGKRRIEVRLADIDAPEWRQAYGRAARDLAGRLIGGSKVRLLGRARDGHGRLVSDVYLSDGRSLAHVLVASGLAWYDGRFRANASLAALEQSARRRRLGLWASARPEPPWEFRRKHQRKRRG